MVDAVSSGVAAQVFAQEAKQAPASGGDQIAKSARELANAVAEDGQDKAQAARDEASAAADRRADAKRADAGDDRGGNVDISV